MGKITSDFRALYWLSRYLDTLPDPPPKELAPSEITREQLVARYAHRCYYLITGEKFNKKQFRNMMKGYEPK